MANGQDLDPGRQMRLFQASMPSFVQGAVFIILVAITAGLAVWTSATRAPEWGAVVGVAGVVLSLLIAASIKVANQWERGIVLRLDEFQAIRGPGLFCIVPVIDRVRLVDTRVLATDIPRQEAITRDNVPVGINGALFFKVSNVEHAVIKIQDYVHAISLLAQTALRDVVGGMTLDDLLSERERIGKRVQEIVDRCCSRPKTAGRGCWAFGVSPEPVNVAIT